MPGGVKAWPYDQVGGTITVQPGWMPQVSSCTFGGAGLVHARSWPLLRSLKVLASSALRWQCWLLQCLRAGEPLPPNAPTRTLCSWPLQDAASWPALDSLQLCWASNFLYATHICSYTCWTSQFVPTNDTACWLAPQPPGAPGSSCFLWPASPPYPGMVG